MDHDRRADDLLGVGPPAGDGPHALAGLAQVHRFSGLIPAPSSKAATAAAAARHPTGDRKLVLGGTPVDHFGHQPSK